MAGWIGVDLDGTLAHYDGNINEIGAPIAPMFDRVLAWLASGQEVKIFTARAHEPTMVQEVEGWLRRYGLPRLEVTAIKDHHMIQLWDDRAVQVERNTGRIIGEPQ